MSTKSQNARIIFGLKVKQLRQEQGLSFADLAKAANMSVSYLNEIEKGKKYPKEDKIASLAAVLSVSFDQLTSSELDKSLAPVSELLKSNFLNELPLDLFGIELAKVVEIIANAPAKVGAFISTLLELSRNYALKEENFYFGALRSFLELHNNYFQTIEDEVSRFISRYDIPPQRPFAAKLLQQLLEDCFDYRITDNGLETYPEMQDLRAVFIPNKKQLLLNKNLSEMQRSFQFGKELGFSFLELKERANTSSLMRSRVFEEVLNHSKATYFSVALHLPLDPFVADVEAFFQQKQWDANAFLGIMEKYRATPEMFYHRLTNVLPAFFGLPKIFFLRFRHDVVSDVYEIDKELHLDSHHQPHSNGLSEHYCRRWISVSLLMDLRKQQKEGARLSQLVAIQKSRYVGTNDEYLCFTIARPTYPNPNHNVSVTLGIVITEELKDKIAFLEDPAISHKQVHTTCERCPISDCAERVIAPVVIQRREKLRAIQKRLTDLGNA
ncbi:MAG: helix-turn-helix domain-containing protein [Saprospiraceae bacterium]